MPKSLIMFGLALIAVWVLLELASMVLNIAPWAGALLILIGVIWHFLQRSEKRKRR